MGANQQYKSSVFADYLTEAGTNNSRLLEISQATGIVPEGATPKIEVNTLKDVLFMDRINDVSFTVDGKLVVLIEHQSTVNQNMPLRMFLYLGRLYEKILDTSSVYRKGLIPIPTPEFIVFYNGTEKQEAQWVQQLSDAYIDKTVIAGMELKVTTWNINYDENVDILKRSKSLRDYSYFVKKVREFKSSGLTLDQAIKEGIDTCVKQGVMKSYLQSNGSEVINMLNTEWNMDEALRVRGEEERKEAIDLTMAVFSWVKEKFGLPKAVEIMENPIELNSFMDKFKKSPEYARFTGIDKP